MDHNSDTSIGSGSAFPKTPWSLILEKEGETERREKQLELLFRLYWRPMYKYVRLKWRKSNEEAKDLVQEFCVSILEGDLLDRYLPELGRFRTFVRVCLDNFVRNDHRDRSRLKRGGDRRVFSIDSDLTGERWEAGEEDDPGRSFDREWKKALMDAAISRVEKEFTEGGKAVYLDVFRAFEVQLKESKRPSYDEIARRFQVSATDVSNYLQAVKRAIRRQVLEQVRCTVADEESFRRELELLESGA